MCEYSIHMHLVHSHLCGVVYSQLVLQSTVVVIEIPAASLEGRRVLLVVVQFCHPTGARWRGRKG